MTGVGFSRTALLLGNEAMQRIQSAKVIIFGIGGVGSWAADALVRSGVQHLTIVDSDVVSPTNINRQLMATTLTVGRPKVEALREHLLTINPEAEIIPIRKAYRDDSADEFNLGKYGYVLDCIDSRHNKMLLIRRACESGATLFSSMGAALKLDPTRVRVAEFRDVYNDPFARILRKSLRREGHMPERKFLCVYSDEIGDNAGEAEEIGPGSEWDASKAKINGSIMPVTATFGLTLASLVIRDLAKREPTSPLSDNSL